MAGDSNAHSNTIRVYTDLAGGTSYTEDPCPCVSIDPPSGTTTDVNRGHLNSTNRLHTTSPGARKAGEATFHYEINLKTHTHVDFLQAMHDAWTGTTESITKKITWPKLAADTNPAQTVFHGYINKQPTVSYPEDDRQMLEVQFKLTDDPVNTDGS